MVIWFFSIETEVNYIYLIDNMIFSMAQKNILLSFPVLAFVVGGAIKGLEMIQNDNMSGEMIGLISIFALSVLMCAFYFVHLK